MSSRQFWSLFSSILIVFFALVFLRANTAQPWNDEAWYAAPSLNLVLHGNTGTPYLETVHKFWRGIDQRTYWVVPLQFFVQVPWIEIFGFSLLSLRAHAIAWGLVSLLAWGFTTWKVMGSRVAALVVMALLACDYQFDSQVSLARMDAMALGLASLAVALYLGLREKRLPVAIALSQACVVGCGLTHPTAGVPAFAGVLFLTLYLDWRNLRLAYILFAAAPYLLGAAFWGWYISAAPDLFRAQFFGNVIDIDRLGGFTHPLKAIVREFGRYQGMAGFAPGMNPLYRIKTAGIVVYFLAIVLLLANREIRRNRGVRLLFGLWLTYLVTMTFYDNTKEVKYAIHIVALYDLLLGIFLTLWWKSQNVAGRAVTVLLGLIFVLVNVGGTLYTALAKDDYHKSYLPAANFLLRHSQNRNDLILAGSEFGFALGFDRNVVDDDDFTYYSRKKPEYIVISNGYRGFLRHSALATPQINAYFDAMVSNEYRKVYDSGEYQIFQRLPGLV